MGGTEATGRGCTLAVEMTRGGGAGRGGRELRVGSRPGEPAACSKKKNLRRGGRGECGKKNSEGRKPRKVGRRRGSIPGAEGRPLGDFFLGQKLDLLFLGFFK